jgi:SsrA-binding protein
MSEKPVLPHRIIAQNRKARHDYHIEETIEAGIMLVGSEVKSIRKGQANITEAHAGEMHDALYLFNSYIPEYEGANRFNHEPRRPRKLLLHKREMKKFLGKVRTKGLSLVALSFYFNEHNKLKVELALGKGKKNYDKREAEKDRDWGREKSRMMKDHGHVS